MWKEKLMSGELLPEAKEKYRKNLPASSWKNSNIINTHTYEREREREREREIVIMQKYIAAPPTNPK
jgi:hypothetical protein